jgi:hypothetical protein
MLTGNSLLLFEDKVAAFQPTNHYRLLRIRGGSELPVLGNVEQQNEIANVSVAVREPLVIQFCAEAGHIKNAVNMYLGAESTPLMKTAVLIVMMGN